MQRIQDLTQLVKEGYYYQLTTIPLQVNIMTTSTTTPTTITNDVLPDPFANMPSLEDALSGKASKVKDAEDTISEDDDTDTAAKKEAEDKDKYAPYNVPELLSIYDSIVFDNSFDKLYSMRGVKFTLRTRSSSSIIKVNQALDNLKAQSVNTYQTYSNYLMLAASLKSYGTSDFEEGNLKGAYDYLVTLPTPVIDILLVKLNEFDHMISLALQAGRENF